MAKIKKTNAMRILDKAGISYQILSYDATDGKIDGPSVASKINRDPSSVYKTLVTQGNSKEFFVFIIPVQKELDLKKAASAASEKSVEMIAVKDIQKHTGYIRGGCSPIGMKKRFGTILDFSANELETIIVSGGKIGMQIELAVADLLQATSGTMKDVTR